MRNTRFRTFLSLCGVALLALGGLRIGLAQHHTGTETTFVGRVVGLACYLGHGTVGDSHRECALTCAKTGIPMAILDQSTQTLYLPLAVEPQEVVHGNQESGERGKVVEAGVGAMPVVMVEPG